MTKLRHPRPEKLLGATLLGLILGTAAFAALVPTEWRQHQGASVAATGLIRLELPDATFDACAPDLTDLRLLDPAGHEVPYLLDRPPITPGRTVAPAEFSSRLVDGGQVLTITTGTTEPITSLLLETPHPHFLCAAHVEIATDDSDWDTRERGLPLFRQWGAEQLTVKLGNRSTTVIRVTLRSANVPFTGARLVLAAGNPPSLSPVATQLARRDEFAGESVLTLELGGAHMPLAALQFATAEPLFMRRVTVAVRETDGASTRERTVGTGTIYRVALDGAGARENLEIKFDHLPTTRELLVHVHNGDSPPLALANVTARRQPWSLLFLANATGPYQVLAGNAQANAPRYDLVAFATDLRTASATTVTPGALENTDGYRPRASLAAAPLPDIPLQGAPLDTTAWTRQRTIFFDHPGVQELELDLAALAGAQNQYADLRLVRDGHQVPYLLEQTSLARSLAITPVLVPDPKRPAVSRWRLTLPQADLPLRRLVLTSSTPLFQRQIKIYRQSTATNGTPRESILASASWSRSPEPGVPEKRIFETGDRPPTDTLWIETDNGDNPAIELGPVQIVTPVVRLVFKADESAGLALAYGNRDAATPRYDLSLVASRLLSAPRQIARLGDEAVTAAPINLLASLRGGPVFWIALALVVIVLLTVVAKLLPKPEGK